MNKIFIILMFLGIVCLLNAEFSIDRPTPSFNPNFNLGGFLSPDKVQMNHSMSFMSGVSSRGDGFYQSAYTNHMRFQLQPNLRVNVDLSLVNMGTMNHNNDFNFKGNDDNQNAFIPAFSLEYKPWENTTIYFEYRQVRGYQTFQNERYNEWWDR